MVLPHLFMGDEESNAEYFQRSVVQTDHAASMRQAPPEERQASNTSQHHPQHHPQHHQRSSALQMSAVAPPQSMQYLRQSNRMASQQQPMMSSAFSQHPSYHSSQQFLDRDVQLLQAMANQQSSSYDVYNAPQRQFRSIGDSESGYGVSAYGDEQFQQAVLSEQQQLYKQQAAAHEVFSTERLALQHQQLMNDPASRYLQQQQKQALLDEDGRHRAYDTSASMHLPAMHFGQMQGYSATMYSDGNMYGRYGSRDPQHLPTHNPVEEVLTVVPPVDASRVREKKRRAKTFPEKLMFAMTDHGNEDTVAWLPDGKSFVIVNPDLFVSEVLNSVFKHSKYASFVRKLHRWGFVRLTSGTGTDCFHHPMFNKNRREWASKIACAPPQQKEHNFTSRGQAGEQPPSLAGVERFIRAKAAATVALDQQEAVDKPEPAGQGVSELVKDTFYPEKSRDVEMELKGGHTQVANDKLSKAGPSVAIAL